MNNEKSFKGHVAVLSANLIFGLNTPISKTILGDGLLSPYALTWMRMLGAAVAFWLISPFAAREKVSLKDLGLLLLASLLGVQLNQIPFLIGLSMTSPVDASIIVTLVPIMTMVFAALSLKEPITWTKGMGVFVGASGAWLLIMSNHSGVSAEGSMIGNSICLISVLSFSLYLTLFKKLIDRYHSVTLMKWMFLFAAVCCSPLCYPDAAAADYASFTWDVYARIGYVVLGATFITYLLIPLGQKLLRPTLVSMYNYVQPVVTSLAAVAMGIGTFGLDKGLAAGLVFAGVYIVTRSKSRAQVLAEKAKTEAKTEAEKPDDTPPPPGGDTYHI